MPRLDVANILNEAFALPWRQRQDFIRVLVVPLTLLFVLTISWDYLDDMQTVSLHWPLLLLYCVVFTLFAVPCHRLVLLGSAEEISPAPSWESRKTRFLLWMGAMWVGLMLAFFASFVVIDTLVLNILGPEGWGNRSFHQIRQFALSIPAYYLLARLSLMLPAIALDRKTSLADAWALGRNNGLRLMFLVCLLPWALSSFLDLAWRDDSSAIEIALLTLLGCVSFVIEICALSLAYRELSRAG